MASSTYASPHHRRPGQAAAPSQHPGRARHRSDGADLAWRFENLIAGQGIGIDMPERINPGPFAARVTFFAPVSLLFFLTVMVIAGATSGPSLHPMHYWFLSAAFFAFHLLLAYLVDHVNLHVAFAISAATSVALVWASFQRYVAPYTPSTAFTSTRVSTRRELAGTPRRSSRSKCFTHTAPAGSVQGPFGAKPKVDVVSGSANQRVLRA